MGVSIASLQIKQLIAFLNGKWAHDLALAARKIEILLFRLVDCLSPRICEEAQTFESQMIHY